MRLSRHPPPSFLLPSASCILSPPSCILPSVSSFLHLAVCLLPPASCHLSPASYLHPLLSSLFPPAASCLLSPLTSPVFWYTTTLWHSVVRTVACWSSDRLGLWRTSRFFIRTCRRGFNKEPSNEVFNQLTEFSSELDLYCLKFIQQLQLKFLVKSWSFLKNSIGSSYKNLLSRLVKFCWKLKPKCLKFCVYLLLVILRTWSNLLGTRLSCLKNFWWSA